MAENGIGSPCRRETPPDPAETIPPKRHPPGLEKPAEPEASPPMCSGFRRFPFAGKRLLAGSRVVFSRASAPVAATHAPIAPKWVCEALSPRTADRDVGPKFAAYEEHGVDEYWILDPETQAHRFYAREGELLVEFLPDAEGWIHSTVLAGFKVLVSDLNGFTSC